MKKFFASGFVVVLLATTCTHVDRELPAGDQLLENLKRRFKNNDYISKGERIINPYEEQGKKAGVLFKEASTALSNFKRSNYVPFRGRQDGHFQLASYNVVQPVVLVEYEQNETFGIESNNHLNIVSEIILEHYKGITESNVIAINSALKNIPLTEIDGLATLDNLVAKNSLTPCKGIC